MSSFSDLYPERRGGVISPSVFQRATGMGDPQHLKTECERNVVWNSENMPMVQSLLAALSSAGCPVTLSRHTVCEMCQPGKELQHAGGFDPALNQIFICCNNADNSGHVHGALVRNLIQMFDACVNKYDFNNPRHLACTEIRKANLANCGFATNMMRKEAKFAVKDQRRNCVRNVAIETLVLTKYVREEVAVKVVDEVFDRCYADLEPIGRQARDADDLKMANDEKFLFGYGS